MWGVELVVMAAMIAVNGLFAAFELALASTTESRLESLKEDGRAGSDAALYMKQNIEGSLAGVQLGITLVGAIAAATGGAGAEEQVAPFLADRFGLSETLSEFLALAAVVAPLTVVTIIFGELVPKVFALRNKEKVCLLLSPPMRLFVTMAWPAVAFFETVVEALMRLTDFFRKKRTGSEAEAEAEELRHLRESAVAARNARLIGKRQASIIHGVADLSESVAGDAMVPLERATTLATSLRPSDALAAALVDTYTRYPVTRDESDPQSIDGYVNFKDIAAATRQPEVASLASLTRPLPSFPFDAPLSECIDKLIQERRQIALVRDDQDRIVGIVTLEDVLEEFLGEIEDEYDHMPTHLIPSEFGWSVGGGVSLERFRIATGARIDDDDESRPLYVWAEERLGRSPQVGDSLNAGDCRLTVRQMRRGRLYEVLAERAKGAE